MFPLISIRFVDQMGWAALMVGIALGLRQFVQQGLGVFGGAIADRFGAKPMIVTGMLLRAAGFATMAVAHEPRLLWFSCFLSGIGGTLFDPPRTALVVKLIRPQHRGRFFSILMMQDSAGAVIGALLGAGCCSTISVWSARLARCSLFCAPSLMACICPHGNCRR